MDRESRKLLHIAFPLTIPVMTGYLFLGMAYGIYMTSAGNPFWYAVMTSIVIYGGALEFVTVSLLAQPFNPVQTFLMAVMIQARHLFYGLAMLDKYNEAGKKKWYLVYGLTDETFSINCSAKIPEDIDRFRFWTYITRMNHIYWMTGCAVGSIAGELVHFNTEGLDFVMTAMFTVILLEQVMKEKSHISTLIGAAASIACLLVFGKDAFLIPAMILIVLLLTLFRKQIESAGEAQ